MKVSFRVDQAVLTGSPGNGNDKGAQAVVIVVLLGQLLLRQLHDGNHLLCQHLNEKAHSSGCHKPADQIMQ